VVGVSLKKKKLNNQRPPGHGLSVRHEERSRAPGESDMPLNLGYR